MSIIGLILILIIMHLGGIPSSSLLCNSILIATSLPVSVMPLLFKVHLAPLDTSSAIAYTPSLRMSNMKLEAVVAC